MLTQQASLHMNMEKNNGFMRDFGNLTAEWEHIYYYALGRHDLLSGNLQNMMTTDVFSNLQKYFGYWYYYTNEVGPGGNHRTVGFIEGNVVRDTLDDSNGGIVCVN